MHDFNPDQLKKLYTPPSDSHKGQNGRVMVIGGSKLFHAASLWALEMAARIADMVYYASVAENNQIVAEAKTQFRNGIVVPRDKIEQYIEEADSILIGPGLPRPDGQEPGDDETKSLTERLLKAYPHKRWVIDGGSLQVIDPSLIPPEAILTPHTREFETLFKMELTSDDERMKITADMAKKYNCTIVLKGPTDIIASPTEAVTVPGGNAGMTRGGTGDVLAGLTASLYAKNPPFLSAMAASFFNKRAAERLFENKGYWYTSTDLIHTIPIIMKETILP